MATLIAVQLEVGEAQLASADAYRRAIDDAVTAAVDSSARSGATLIVLPELAGCFALYALAPARARKAGTLARALGAAALRRPLDVLRGVATAHVLDARHAVLAALAPDAEQLWRGIVGPLARRCGAYVVAGSHLHLAASGELTNAATTFGADGRLLATTDKVNLVPGLEDGAPGALKLARGSAARVPIVDVAGLGKLATLIGYDACTGPAGAHERWEPVAARLAARGGVDVVTNPVASTRIPAAHWQRAGLRASIAETRVARYGVVAHLVGSVLDLGFAGVSEVMERRGEEVVVLARTKDAESGGHASAYVELV
jgi:predicted amidohydrolase